ncbi:MAG: SDR family oxidoreductase [bacterium]|nr:SDR family oxidoreductase [bacterium]
MSPMNTTDKASTAPSSPRVAVVTGASSGIGAATTHRLVKEGYRVHAVARREDRLASLAAATGCDTHVLDVTDSDALMALASTVGPIDLLVNNAGLGRMDAPLAEGTLDDITRTIDTNVTALIVATMAFLPPMIERRSGHVVNIGSMAGHYPLSSATYGASKAAVHRFCTNIRLELCGTGVRVTEICPGRVATEFYDVAVTDPTQREGIKNSGVEEITAAELADTIYYAVSVPAHVNINRIELQPTEQTYGGMSFVAKGPEEDDIA